MKLKILGTGTFFANITKTASAFLLETDNLKILIDCGPGTLVRLSQIGIKPEDLDYVFLTHFHPDHTADLFSLFMNYCLADFKSPGSITNFPKFIGPTGISQFMINYGQNSELLALNKWNKIEFVDYQPSMDFDNFKFKAFKVDHTAFGLKANAYALRFEINDQIIAFSGDSIDCQGVKDASKNTDLFICDASYSKGNGSPAHMDTISIGEICQSSQVKKVILTHCYPESENMDLVSEVKEKFTGEIIKGQDLTEIEL